MRHKKRRRIRKNPDVPCYHVVLVSPKIHSCGMGKIILRSFSSTAAVVCARRRRIMKRCPCKFGSANLPLVSNFSFFVMKILLSSFPSLPGRVVAVGAAARISRAPWYWIRMDALLFCSLIWSHIHILCTAFSAFIVRGRRGKWERRRGL